MSKRIRTLVVDDHAVVRRGIREIIEEEIESVEVAEAQNAQEAVAQIRQEQWDVVVLDITMPDRSGLDVLKEAKAHSPKLPVLMLSMHPEDQYAVRLLKAGASGYLTKESAPEELTKAVRKVLAGDKYVSPTLAEKLALQLVSNSQTPHDSLSDREYEVMCLLASGRRVSEVAEQLFLSVKTISTYRSRILEKMKMQNNSQLTAYAIRRGLIR